MEEELVEEIVRECRVNKKMAKVLIKICKDNNVYDIIQKVKSFYNVL